MDVHVSIEEVKKKIWSLNSIKIKLGDGTIGYPVQHQDNINRQ